MGETSRHKSDEIRGHLEEDIYRVGLQQISNIVGSYYPSFLKLYRKQLFCYGKYYLFIFFSLSLSLCLFLSLSLSIFSLRMHEREREQERKEGREREQERERDTETERDREEGEEGKKTIGCLDFGCVCKRLHDCASVFKSLSPSFILSLSGSFCLSLSIHH